MRHPAFFPCLLYLILVSAMMSSAEAKDLTGDEWSQRARQAFLGNNLPEAERFLRLALQEYEASNIVNDGFVETLGDLSSIATRQQRYSESERLLTRALDVLKSYSYLNQRRMPVLFGNLATVYQLTGRFKLAERTFRGALRWTEKYLGTESDYNTTLLSNLGALYSQMGNHK